MEITIAILGLLGVSGIVGTVVSRYVRPKATPLEILQEVQEERTEDRRRIDRLESAQRITIDYVHELRQHIVDGNPPPPPAWPEGLNR
ncbi:hypothetical protein [Nocardioides kribbensis]|uniref:hypothetical protein n=1 Tax=Nocardioides kribbensis TaxID=305517 RepID=UPI00187AF766|nr:hypothetical protein [Nocardioides kribbensis]